MSNFPGQVIEFLHLRVVRDVAASRAFYTDVLGATVLREIPSAGLPRSGGGPAGAVLGWRSDRGQADGDCPDHGPRTRSALS